MKIIEELRDLVAKNKTKEALRRIKDEANGKSDNIHKEAIELSGRLEKLEEDLRRALISNEEYVRRRAAIDSSTLDLITKFSKLIIPIPVPKDYYVLKKSGLWYKILLGSLLAIISSVLLSRYIPSNQLDSSTINTGEVNKIPIGTIIPSMLSEHQFNTYYNLDGKKQWVLANGDEVEQSTKYYKITGKMEVPDLRGVFIRGQNLDKDKNKGNPEKKDLGEYQEDVANGNIKIFHGTIYQGSSGSTFSYALLDHDIKQGHDIFELGNEETRPRNVTVNYFIKID